MLSQVISTYTDEIILYFLANRHKIPEEKQKQYLALIGKMVGFSLQLDSMQGLGRKNSGPHVCGRSFEDLLEHLDKVYGLRIRLEPDSCKPLKWGSLDTEAIEEKCVADSKALEVVIMEFEKALEVHTDSQSSSYPSILIHQIQELLSEAKAL